MIKYALILSTLLLAGCSHPKLGSLNHLLPGGSTYLAEESRLEARAEWASAAAAVNVAGDNQGVAAGVDVGKLWTALEAKDTTKVWAYVLDLFKGAVYSYGLYYFAEDYFDDDTPPSFATVAPVQGEVRPSITLHSSTLAIRDADVIPDISAVDSVILIDMNVDAAISRHSTLQGLEEQIND